MAMTIKKYGLLGAGMVLTAFGASVYMALLKKNYEQAHRDDTVLLKHLRDNKYQLMDHRHYNLQGFSTNPEDNMQEKIVYLAKDSAEQNKLLSQQKNVMTFHLNMSQVIVMHPLNKCGCLVQKDTMNFVLY